MAQFEVELVRIFEQRDTVLIEANSEAEAIGLAKKSTYLNVSRKLPQLRFDDFKTQVARELEEKTNGD